ncbi:MAG: hypothetical protein WBN07_08255 [Woeseiaceae bacterium]
MSEEAVKIKQKAPWHLWVVGVVSLLWNAIGAMDYVMTQTRNEAYMSAFSPEQLEFFYGIPSWAVATWAIAVWGGVLGSILLLLRQRHALGVFAVSLLAMLVTSFQNFVLSNGLEVIGDPFSLGFSALIFLVAIALVVYARVMYRRGILV